MALFRVSNERAQFDAAGNEATDQYGAGIRFTQSGNARVTTGSATNYNQGIPMSSTGQVAIVDATAGLPAGTIFHNGLPISADKVCVSRNATAVVSNGLPYDAAGAVAADINFDLNFVENGTLNPSVTFTRASTATYFNSAGVLTSAAINESRRDFDPATLAVRGLLIEEARTNGIRNNTMQGAVAGTPGTLPTNWQISNAAGLSSSVIGFGSESGVNYIDIRVFGTSTGNTFTISPEAGGVIAASNGQTWTASQFLRLVGGSTANILSFELGWSEQNSVPSFLAFNVGTISIPTTGSLAANRVIRTGTNGQATTAFVRPVLNFQFNIGVAIDITLRIGLPQLEQGAFATSVIPTTTTALTRNADQASVNTLSPWFNATAGTVYSEFVINSTAPTSGFPTATSFNNGTTNNRINPAYLNDAINALDYFVSDGGVTQVGLSSITYTAGNVAKMAAAYATNDFALSTNGGAVLTDTSGSVPSVTAFNLGNQLGGNFLNGYLRRITYYPRRLSNAELQAITA